MAVRADLVALEVKLAALSGPLAYPDLNIYASECFEVIDEYRARR
jgi:hypothetical protein